MSTDSKDFIMDKERFSHLNDVYQNLMRGSNRFLTQNFQWNNFSFVPLIGKPGAGKSTSLQPLKDLYNANIVTTGDIFRSPQNFGFSKVETAAIKDLCEFFYVELKKLVPDDLTTRIVARGMSHSYVSGKLSAPYICFTDVYPRSLGQVELSKEFGPINEVWHIDAPDDVCLERLAMRDTYLDRPDSGHAQERIDEYYARTQPALDALKKSGYEIKRIDGTQPIAQVQSIITSWADALNIPKK